MDEEACIGRIAGDLGALGIGPGETMLVHSSFKALGPVPGGIETVIRGFEAAVGDAGTLLLPALSYSLRPPEIFDVRSTPTVTGAIPEFFRQRPGTIRSLHPTHSVCAIGPRTRALLGEHGQDSTPCGPRSPLRKLAETQGKIVLLGCGLRPNTSMHALEEIAPPPYLFGLSHLFTLVDGDGMTLQKTYRTHGFGTHGYAQRYERVALLDEAPQFLRQGRVLEAETFVLDAPALRRAVVARLVDDPLFFVDKA